MTDEGKILDCIIKSGTLVGEWYCEVPLDIYDKYKVSVRIDAVCVEGVKASIKCLRLPEKYYREGVPEFNPITSRTMMKPVFASRGGMADRGEEGAELRSFRADSQLQNSVPK